MSSLETSTQLELDFQKISKLAHIDIVPVAVQDIHSKEVLIIAYANQEALKYSLEHKIACFWSTSRCALWIKGDTSGEYLSLHQIKINCEQNSLLYLVEITSQGACHTKDKNNRYRMGCFYREVVNTKNIRFITE